MTTVHITNLSSPPPPPPASMPRMPHTSSQKLEIQAYCGHKTTKNPFEVKICCMIKN